MKGEREKKEEKEEGKGGREEQGRKRGRENVERPGIEGMERSESLLATSCGPRGRHSHDLD